MPRPRSRSHFYALATLAILPISSRALAIDWKTPADGTFSTASNWSTTTPGPADIVQFNLSSTTGYTVSFTSPTTTSQLLIGNDKLTFNLAGNTYNDTNTYGILLGYTPGFGIVNSDLTVIGGGTLSSSNAIYLGWSPGSTAKLTLDGANTILAAQAINLGFQGTGTLNVKNGAVVTSTGSISVQNPVGGAGSALTVDGAGSKLSGGSLGLGASTTLTATNGAAINTTSSASISGGAIATLDNSTWNASSFSLSSDGAASSLIIRNGSSLIGTSGMSIGNGGTSITSAPSVSVQGAGTTLNLSANFGTLTVGQNGGGSLSISAGAVVSDNRSVIGSGTGSNASATLDGAGSSWTNDNFYVGSLGTGSLAITNGASFISTGSSVSQIGQLAGSTGTVTVSGTNSSLNATSDLYIANSGTATFNLQSGGKFTGSYVHIGAAAGSTGTFNLSGSTSTWNATGSVGVGGTSFSAGGKGIVNQSDGVATIVGTLNVWNTAGTSYNLTGGTLNVGTLNTDSNSTSSHFHWTAGTLNFTGSSPTLSSAATAPLGNSLSLNSGMTLGVTGSGQSLILSSGSSLTINGGTLNPATPLTTSAGSTINVVSGSLTRGNESLSSTILNESTIAGPTTAGQNLTFAAAVSGTGSYTGNVAFNSSFSPGDVATPTATVNLAKATFGSADTLTLNLAGASTLNHLNFSTSAAFAGTLTVSLINGFSPSAGQSFDLFDGTTTGTFSTVNLPTLTGPLTWITTSLYTTGVISIVAGPSTIDWASAVSGNFSDATKWTGGITPLTADSARFNTSASSAYTTTLTANTTTDRLYVGNDKVNLDLAGKTYTVANTGVSTSAGLQLGTVASQSANLTLQSTGSAGTLTTTNANLGQVANSTGSVTIANSNVSWNSSNLYLGGTSAASAGAGILNLSAGNVTISGTLKAWNTSNTAINLSGGALKVGTLDMNSVANTSRLNWTGGTLEISNSSPTASSTGNLPANLTLSTGMTLKVSGSAQSLSINSGAGNTFTLDGGTAIVAAALNVGIGSNGTLALKNGATLSDASVALGSTGNSTAVATVDGSATSWTTTGAFAVGGSTSSTRGSLTLNAGAVTVGGTFTVGSGANSAVSLTGGTLKVGNFTNSTQSNFSWTGGTLEISNSSPTLSSTGNLPANLTLSSSKTLKVTGSSNTFIVNTGTANTFTIDGGTTSITGASSLTEFATTGTSSIDVKNAGTLNTAAAFLANNNNTTASATIEGANTKWIATATLSVGEKGAGTLTIKTGAVVSDTEHDIGIGNNATGTVSIDGQGSKWTSTGSLFDAVSGSGSISVTHGGYLSNGQAILGYNAGKTGSVSVDGADPTDPSVKSTWVSSGQIAIGYTGNGNLSITNGALVSNTDAFLGTLAAATPSTGTVTVDGAGSTWTNSGGLAIGQAGIGTLTISHGASVSNTVAYLGYSTASTGGRNPVTLYASGTVTLNDPSSSWTSSDSLYVGGSAVANKGSGTLTINNGSVSVANALKIWNPLTASTHSTVNLAGGALKVGSLDTDSHPSNFNWTAGTLELTNSSLTLDTPSTSSPLGNSLTLNPNMTLKISGSGKSLTIASGATLTNNGGVVTSAITINSGGTLINTANMAISILDARAGTLTNTGTLTVQSEGDMKLGNQPLGGDIIIHGLIEAATTPGQSTTLTGNVSGEGSISGNVSFAGSYSPGNSPASVTLETATFTSTDTLKMELAGTTEGAAYDHINFTNSATLGGTLQILLLNSFTPISGEHFNLFDGSLHGTFATLDLPTLSPGLLWDTSSLYTTGDLSITTAVPLPAACYAALPLLATLAYTRRRRATRT